MIPLESISGVLDRIGPDAPEVPEASGLTVQDRAYVTAELRAAWVGLLNALSGRVVNRPDPTAVYRPLFAGRETAVRVRECGLRIPPWIVASEITTALGFYRRHGCRVLVGSLEGREPGRWIRGPDGEEELRTLLALHPLYLQGLPPGRGVELFIVGERTFVREPPGPILGGGRESLPRPDLTPELRRRCLELARALRLDFALLRLQLDETGDLYCLDIDVFPDFDRCAPTLSAEITTALAGLLKGGDLRP
jgi:hypothetical protein